MRRITVALAVFFLSLLCLAPAPVRAQDPPLRASPPALVLTGLVDGGAMAATVRLAAREPLAGLSLFASDLADASHDGRARDPLPSSAVTLLPAAQFERLEPGTPAQVVVQVAPPQVAGTYAGALTVRWQKPSPGELAVPLTVVARTRPSLALHFPTQATIGGVKGQVVSRRVVLREVGGGSPLIGLRAIPQDLVAEDGRSVLAAARVSVDLPASQIEGGGLLTATVGIDLRGAPAGTYSGQVLFAADAGNLLAWPVTVNVRHGAWVAGLVLVFGVGLGLGLSAYQARGRLRDELILRVVAARQAMQDDPALDSGFGPRLNPALEEAERAIRAARWDEAGTALSDVEGMVRRWKGGRESWIAQLDYLREKVFPRLGGESVTLLKLRQQAGHVQASAADLDTPAALRDRILEVEGPLVRFERIQVQLQEVGRVRTRSRVAWSVQEGWRGKEDELARRLDTLLPDDAAGWQQLEKDVEALRQKIEQDMQSQAAAKDVEAMRGTGGARGWLGEAFRAVLPAGLLVPETGPISTKVGAQARYRLGWFTLITYALGGLALAGAGFAALYLSRPTFGAQPVADYLSLLAWGLGGQTSVAAVANLVRGLGVPFGKEGAG